MEKIAENPWEKPSQRFQGFLSLGVNNLQDYSTVRDRSVCGCTKSELVTSAFSVAKVNLLIIWSSEK